MPTYATLVRFSAQELTNMSNTIRALEEGAKTAAELGVKPIGAYATLGPYDVMIIYEAANEKAAVNMAMGFGTKWGGRAETWTVIPMDELIKPAKPARKPGTKK